MRLSTRGRYGLKAVMELARRWQSDQLVSMRDLSLATGLSASYLEQLFKKLRTAKIIKSVRGAQGGYTLARPVENIVVGDVLRALEGQMAPSACAEKDYQKCKQREFCVESYLYQKIRESMDAVIDSMTLADMLKIEKEQSLHRPQHRCGDLEES